MQRIRQRRHGVTGDSVHAMQASHVIKIGFDSRAKGADRPGPGKLPGFLICRNSLDGEAKLIVDMACMSKLGYTAEQIQQAKKLQLSSPGGLLPTELHFVLANDAHKHNGVWQYGGTFAEEYESWAGMGLFCHGDGCTAKRRVSGGATIEIACIPHGREGTTPEQWCPISVEGKCKGRSRTVLSLYHPGARGAPEPLSDAFGWQARFRFDTSSETNAIRILAALDAAADRLQGNLHAIPGVFSFMINRKRTGKESGATVGIVGQVNFVLNEEAMSDREREMRNDRIEDHRVFVLGEPSKPTALPMGRIDEVSQMDVEEEEEMYLMDDEVPKPPAKVEDSAPVEPEFPDAAVDTDGDSKARSRAVRTMDKLLMHYPEAKDPLAFEMHTRWGAKTIDDIADADLDELVNLIAEIYGEHKERDGQ